MAFTAMMNLSETGAATLAMLIVGMVFIFLWRCSSLDLDPEEPPLLKPTIPIIGHGLGMRLNGYDFYRDLYTRAPIPIATLPLMNGKMYLIHSPELVLQMFKCRPLSFEPIVNALLGTLCSVSKGGMTIYTSEEFASKWLKIMYTRMMGTPLQSLNLKALDVILARLNGLQDVTMVDDVYMWLRLTLSRATIKSLMGEDNPFNDESIIDAYWAFDNNLNTYLGSTPKFVAREAYRARGMQLAAYEAYFDAESHLQASTSDLVRDAFRLCEDYGMQNSDKAGLLLAIVHGGLSNSFPTLMRHFDNIFTRPGIIESLREEALQVVESSQGNGSCLMTIHIAQLEQKLPLLVACFKETQRLASDGSVNRVGSEDVRLTDDERTYLLKAYTAVQCTGAHNHQSRDVWGEDADQFIPDRWLTTKPSATTIDPTEAQHDKDKPLAGSANDFDIHRGKFFPFGGGKHLCPGRNFATTEIWSLTIALVLGFEITDAEGQGLRIPEYVAPPVTRGIARYKPGQDVRARFVRRKGWEKAQWRVAL